MVLPSSGKRSLKKSTNKRSKKRGAKAKNAQRVSGRKGKGQKGKGQKGKSQKGKGRKGKVARGAAGSAAETGAEMGDEVTEVLSPRQKLLLERAATARRKKTISFISTVSLCCAFVGLLVGLIISPKLGVAVFGALMCLILSFKYQRLALYAFLIYIPFAGTVTYALGGNSILQIAKDIFYIPALIGVFQFCRKHKLPLILPKAIKPPLILLAMMVIATAMVANVPDQIGQVEGKLPIVMAIWGAKILFGYVPMVACMYYLIRNKEDLVGLLRMQAVLVLIASLLGLTQYVMLSTGICEGTTGVGQDLFRASLDARCFVGGSVLYSPEMGQIRLPGTFVAPWQWGWFLISAVFFSFGTTFSDQSILWRLVGAISLLAVFVMAVLSGQRIALVLVPTVFVGLLLLTGSYRNLKGALPVGILLGLIVSYLIVTNPVIVTGRVNSLISRWEASPPQQFIAEQFEQVWDGQEGLFGNGVGRATNSARTFGKTRLIETYHPKLIYELGPLGLLAAMSVYTTLTVATFRIYRKTKDKNLRIYAASMWVFILFISYCPYYYPLDVDPVGVYYWLAAGIVLKIPELERQEVEKAAARLNPEAAATMTKAERLRRKRTAVPTFE